MGEDRWVDRKNGERREREVKTITGEIGAGERIAARRRAEGGERKEGGMNGRGNAKWH